MDVDGKGDGSGQAGAVPAFLAGGGEMGERMRALDWAATPLGAPAAWPQSLKTAIRIMLTSRQPIWIGWGPDLVFFYNDPYKAIIGGKHPQGLGRPTAEVWREIWHDIAPMLSQAMTGVEGTYVENQLLVMERNGYPEETYYTFSYSPIPDDDGTPGGIICANTDDTQSVIGERQLALLRELAARTAEARTVGDVSRQAVAALASDARDLPFALLYLMAPGAEVATLAAVHGLPDGHPAAPASLVPGAGAPWPTPDGAGGGPGGGPGGGVALVDGIGARFAAAFPSGPWATPPERAAVLPLPAASESGHEGILIVGLNPFRLFDDHFRRFLGLVAGQIAAALANADAHEGERRRAEALAEIDRAKTAFFSNVSHEFRTPLTLMLGPLEESLAEAGRLPPDEVERLRIVHRNGQRLLRLVNALLDVSRLEAGRVQARFQPTDLAALTAELASNFRSATERAGLDLVVDCPALPRPVHVDRDSWEKIVLNLLSNAFKFTLQGAIEVRLRAAGGAAELTVRDTGTGIPAGELPRLFERFHRVENAAGRSHEGSGIGLSLVQELVRLHGGVIGVASAVGEGTTFTLTVPFGTAHLPAGLVEEAQSTPATSGRADAFVEEALRWLPDTPLAGLSAVEAPAPARHGDRPRILLADDNADMRDYVRHLLAGRYRVEAVPDGAAALAAIRADRPDLLLSDVMMPRLDGFGLVRAVRGDAGLADLPIILLSARAGEDESIEGRAAGADDYLVKPFSARELVASVDSTLALARVRRQAADAVRASERRLRDMANAVPHLVWTADATGRVDFINERAGAYSGFCQDEDGTWAWERALHPDDREPTKAAWARSIATGAPYHTEQRIAQLDGGHRWHITRAVAAHDAEGRVTCWYGTATDVHDLKTVQEELHGVNCDLERRVQEAAAQVVQLQKMESIGRLTGGVAHDFNNLLMAILTSLEVVKRRLPAGDERLPKLIDNAMQAAHRGASLTQRMLAFARKQELRPEPVALPELVFGMTDLLTRSLGPQVAIETRFPVGTPRALVDANQLEMAILNLAVNARDAMPEGGTLTIAAGVTGDGFVHLTVRDTGAGMDAATLGRATEPFFTTKETGKGTGLGLSMVQGLAEQSGGRFVLTSDPGQGTAASILLPVAAAEAWAMARPPMPPGASPDGPAKAGDTGPDALTVLVVDDDPLVLLGISTVLETLGHAPLRAGSAREALEVLDACTAVDVVVTDQVMPGMTGVQLAAAVAERRPGLPVVLATGYAEWPDGVHPAVVHRLRKPFRPEELMAALSRASERA